jgi:DNA-binding transcriptional MerR regulator
VTRAPVDRSHLSIGEVLSLLQEEFPDVTISKIRFLESQGLLDPERTPSGYRKFYEADIDRLRWILRQQKDHYLPLKVIKDRLDDARSRPAPAPSSGVNNGGAAAAHGPPERGRRGAAPAGAAAATALALDERPPVRRPPDAPTTAASPLAAAPTSAPSVSDAPAPARSQGPVQAARADSGPGLAPAPAAAPPGAAPTAPAAAGRATVGAPTAEVRATDSISLTAEELVQHSGLSLRDLRDLERYGLIESSAVGDDAYYDGDALVIAQTAAGFLQHGIEARHMRTYKVAVDREAGFFEQIVLPLLKQRNPEARQRARETVVELVRLGQQMRAVLLARELRNVAGTT